MAVDLVTIHHEGAGAPSDVPRGADGGYTYWIGATRWERLRSVYTSYATLHFNHVSLDICLSGNRMDHPVTDADIALIHGAFMDAHAHGEVVDVPRVQAHRDNNGKYEFRGSLFSTVCPGDLTMARWPLAVAACRVATAPSVDLSRLVKLDQWRNRVKAHPLRFGDQNADVAFLVDRLREHHYLRRGVRGDKFGKVLQAGIYRLKLAHPQIGNTDGRAFGGTAADVLVSMG